MITVQITDCTVIRLHSKFLFRQIHPRTMLADTDEGTAGAGTGASLQKQEKRLTDSFFDVTCIELAKNLLGTILVRRLRDGTVLKGKIVETECYLGAEDKASHSYKGKMTPRNEAMFMKPGTIYVYQTYGMYYCMNISSQGWYTTYFRFPCDVNDALCSYYPSNPYAVIPR